MSNAKANTSSVYYTIHLVRVAFIVHFRWEFAVDGLISSLVRHTLREETTQNRIITDKTSDPWSEELVHFMLTLS